MKSVRSWWLLGVVVAAACGFDPPQVQLVCQSSADCFGGSCTEGRCVDDVITDAASDVPTADGGADAQSDAPDATGGCAIDEDDDGFFVGDGCPAALLDCDDTNRDIYPGAPTACNGADNDCDTVIDTVNCECFDGATEACGSDEGACVAGNRTCARGRWGECLGGVGPTLEICDGIDNDCNAVQDEGCPCVVGQTRVCGIATGACETGVQTCVDGEWGDCEGGVSASPEVCDGVDNNCDGVVDNNPADVGTDCSTGQPGRCALGQVVCSAGARSCRAVQGAIAETCNDIDDDCDASVDEGVTQNCTSACGAGTQTCQSGTFGDCVANNPPAEVCDGKDNNCDSRVDESFPEDGMACESGLLGVCGSGAFVCTPEGVACEPTTAPSAEVCDGLDNDCDGLVDEDTNGRVLSEQCGGSCPTRSVRLCFNGQWSACDRDEAEVCNQADSNCDGLVDNQATCYRVCPGGGIAPGTLNCGAGTCALPPEICGDGIDNNCDGIVDQNCTNSLNEMVYVPGGTFVMGSQANDADAAADEMPQHLVNLAPYYIDRYEVTRGEYTQCFLTGNCSALALACPFQNPVSPDRPVLCVSWDQARSYCQWRGGRLPTEAEWEKAARGPFARTPIWPWGNTPDANRAVLECNAANGATCVQDVDSLDAGVSYYGVHHMAGNVAEWVDDFFDADFYGPSLVSNPRQTANQGLGHSIRGGSYRQSLEFARTANRAANLDLSEVGFRCVRDNP